MKSKNIVVVGAGYVGLITAVCLAKVGHSIICVDENPDVVTKIRQNEPHIHERFLRDQLREVSYSGHFCVSPICFLLYKMLTALL